MDKHAYCTQCGRYVELAGEACPEGHGGASLRDVRSGPLPALAAQRQSARPGVSATASAPAPPDPTESAGRIIGWLVVVVPALILAVLMVALTEPQYEGAGLGTVGAWLASLATVAVTLGAALAWGWSRFLRKRR
jgi:hypothetical protein